MKEQRAKSKNKRYLQIITELNTLPSVICNPYSVICTLLSVLYYLYSVICNLYSVICNPYSVI